MCITVQSESKSYPTRILKILSVLVISGMCSAAFAQEFPTLQYDNVVYRDGIHTVQLYNSSGQVSWPAIGLGTGEALELHFDEFSTSYSDFSYYVIHCTPDWLPSELEPNEYLTGFTKDDISNIEPSYHTRVDYMHYTLSWPNDLMKPKISGNYVLVVYADGQPENIVLSQRFVVYEQLVGINASLVPSSNPAQRYSHHEVDFSISTVLTQIYDPMRDLRVTLLQNFDWNTSIDDLKPTFIREGELLFDYNGENNFPARNEWRDFEDKDLRYASMEVEAISEQETGWHAYLRPDAPQGSTGHLNKDDLSGRFYIHSDRAGNSNEESEYVQTHFVFTAKERPGVNYYVVGGFSFYKALPEYKMTFDPASGNYILDTLFKQGYYNYRYAGVGQYGDKDPFSYSEGNFDVTENEYHVIAYHYDRFLGAWRCVGFHRVDQP